MQLSGEIAFVSAYEYGVRYVTATTVEASEQGGLTDKLIGERQIPPEEGCGGTVLSEIGFPTITVEI
jgi:hypothetical protein